MSTRTQRTPVVSGIATVCGSPILEKANSTVSSSASCSCSPSTTPVVQPRSLSIDFVVVQDYETMKERYNVVYQQDMLQVGKCDYDGVDTWIDAVRPLMKQPPWGQITVSGACLDEIKEIGGLAQVDSSRLERVLRNSIYVPSLISKIDQLISEHYHGRAHTTNVSSSSTSMDNNTPLVFCRTNECSMKQSTSYKVRPFKNGTDIMDQLLRDRRLITWLSMSKYNISSTTLYLSDFDTSFKSKNEYRVFIWSGRVTGISQYRWFETEDTEYHTEDDARRISAEIVEFVEGPRGLIHHLREKRGGTSQDRDDEVALVADVVHAHGHVYLVEINLFGGETGCGSSLFHWKRDEHILYSDGQHVVCRFLSRA